MEFLELIPDSIQAASGNPPSATGAAASDPIEDTSDATYIQFNALNQWIRVSFADLVLPSNKRIWGAYIMARETFTEQADGSGWGAFSMSGGKWGTNAVIDSGTGLAGVQGSFAGENAWVDFYSPWATKDWAGAEFTQAQLNAVHWYQKVTLLNAPVVYLRVAKVRLGYALITQPLAANTSPTNGASGVSKTPTVQWSYTGQGEAQKSFRVKIFTQAIAEGGGFDPATSATVYDSGVVTSSATSHTIPAGLLALGSSYYFSVQVAKSMDQYGYVTGNADYFSQWSTATKFTINAAPVVTVSTPADPTTNATTPVVTWAYTDADNNPQVTYQVRVFNAAQYGIGGFDAGTSPATWDSGEITDTPGTVRTKTIGVAIANATYRAYVRSKDSDGNYSAWAYKQWVQNVTAPSNPLLTASQIAGTTDLLLQWEAAWNGPIPDFFRIERSDDGGTTWADVRGAGYQAIPWKILDTFTRADNAASLGNDEKTVPSAWTANTGVWGILTNRAYTAAATALANATMDAGVSDVIAQISIPVLPGANACGMILRRVDANNYWVAQVSNGNIFLTKYVAGAPTNVLGPFAAVAGDAITVIADGTGWTLRQNGVQKGTAVDAANQGGTQHGLWMNNTNVGRLDDFTLRALTSARVTDREASPREMDGITLWDSFARADATASLASADVGGAWVVNAGTWGIIGNQAYTSAAAAGSIATIDSGIADILASLTIAVLPGANSCGLVVRYVDANNYWTAQVFNGNLYLVRLAAGVQTNVLGPYAAATGDIIQVRADANQLTLYQNGVVKGQVITDATNQTATKHGLFVGNNTAARLDNFSVVSLRKPSTLTYLYRATVWDQLIGDVAASEPRYVGGSLVVTKVWVKLPYQYATTDDLGANATFPVNEVFLPKAVNKSRSVHRPLGKTVPVVVRGVSEGRTFPATFITETQAVYDKLRYLLDRNVTLVLLTPKQLMYVDVQNWTDEEHLWDDLHSEPPVWRIGASFQEVSKP